MIKKLLLPAFLVLLFLYPQYFGTVKAAVELTASPVRISNRNTQGVDIIAKNLIPGKEYTINIKGENYPVTIIKTKEAANNAGQISFHLCQPKNIKASCSNETFLEDKYSLEIYEGGLSPNARIPVGRLLAATYFNVYVQTEGTIEFINSSFTTIDDIIIKVADIPEGSYIVRVDGKDPAHKEEITACIDAKKGEGIPKYNLGKYLEGEHNIEIYTNKKELSICGVGALVTYRTFTINNQGGNAGPKIGIGTTSPKGIVRVKECKDKDDPGFDSSIHMHCASAGGISCSNNLNDSNPGFITAIGCIHTNPTKLVEDILKFVLGIGGGLAFLLMLVGAFQMLTSAGNPDHLNAGRERITSAVIGLLLIIFAVLILQIIGVDILQIPGFGK